MYLYMYAQGHYSPAQNHELRQLNPNLKTVLYINSHTADGYTLEHTTGGRLGVLCYRAGYLSKPVTRQDTAIQVSELEPEEAPLPGMRGGLASRDDGEPSPL